MPEICRVADLYEKPDQKRIAKLCDVFSQASGVDRFQFVLEALPGVYSDDVLGDLKEKDADKIVKEFAADAKILETGISRAKNRVAEAVYKVFGLKTGDFKACQQVVAEWYEALNPKQQDSSQYDDDEVSQMVKVLGGKEADFEDKLMVGIPSCLGFGPVRGWTTLRFDEYAAKIKAAKKTVDDARIKVPRLDVPPEVKLKPGESPKVEKPEGVKEFAYTTDGEDPKASEKVKRIRELSGIWNEVRDKPCVVIKVRTVDASGNFGDLQQVKLVNADREFDVNVVKGIFESEGHFKFPEDGYSLVLVLRSIVAEAEKRKVIGKKLADQLNSAISQLPEKKSH